MNESSKLVIKRAASKVKVTGFVDHKDYLARVYRDVKEELGSYSYIRFAEDLGFGTTNMMRLVIVGERPLTVKAAQKIADAFDLHGDERRYFTTVVDYAHERDPATRDKLFAQLMSYKSRVAPETLDANQLEYFSEWYNPVLREMTMLPDFQADPEWIRARLRFPLHMGEIKRALELLVKLGYVRRDEKSGRHSRSAEKVHTPFEVDSLAIVRYHQKLMEIARESITRVKEDEREVSALTACIPTAAIPELKRRISQLLDEMEAQESRDSGGQVYQLNVQLFPFTKG
jgi:uncharacterized protein (TIGR02147 family)